MTLCPAASTDSRQCHVIMSPAPHPYGVAPSSGAQTACLIALGMFALDQSQIAS